jgi:hypothetical protein
MAFLMKVKRAKHALDKACRWTWKVAFYLLPLDVLLFNKAMLIIFCSGLKD